MKKQNYYKLLLKQKEKGVSFKSEFKRHFPLIALRITLIFVVAFFSLLSGLLYLFALTKVYVSYAAPLKRISTLFVTLAGGKLFAEADMSRRLWACVIMIVGAFMLVG